MFLKNAYTKLELLKTSMGFIAWKKRSWESD